MNLDIMSRAIDSTVSRPPVRRAFLNFRAPNFSRLLKTGNSGISNAQMTKYQSNLPPGTPVYTVTPNGHNVPTPQSMAGFGAGLNTGYLLGDALSGGANVGSVNPRASK